MGIEIKDSKIIRRYKCGYVIKEEIWCTGSSDETPMRQAYTPSGDYIGSKQDAHRLCYKRGIAPEKASPNHGVCSIGFSKKDNKWFGWSHRGIFGYTIGSKVTKKSCAFNPSNKKEFYDSLKEWYKDRKDVELVKVHDGVKIISGNLVQMETYPEKWGRGEWEAKTMEDAKRMAIDYASGIS